MWCSHKNQWLLRLTQADLTPDNEERRLAGLSHYTAEEVAAEGLTCWQCRQRVVKARAELARLVALFSEEVKIPEPPEGWNWYAQARRRWGRHYEAALNALWKSELFQDFQAVQEFLPLGDSPGKRAFHALAERMVCTDLQAEAPLWQEEPVPPAFFGAPGELRAWFAKGTVSVEVPYSAVARIGGSEESDVVFLNARGEPIAAFRAYAYRTDRWAEQIRTPSNRPEGLPIPVLSAGTRAESVFGRSAA